MSTKNNQDGNFISGRIVSARKSAGMKQKEVAEKLGIPAVTVNRWEKGKRTPSATNLNQLAMLYGCEVGSFLARETKEKTGEPLVSEPPPRYAVAAVHQQLRPDQAQLLTYYDQLCPDQRDMVLVMVQGFARQCLKSGKSGESGGGSQESSCG